MDLAILLSEEETARFEDGDERIRGAIRATVKLLPAVTPVAVIGKDEDGKLYDVCIEADGAIFVLPGGLT